MLARARGQWKVEVVWWRVSVARCHATGLSGRRSAAMVNAGTRYDSHHMVLYTCTLGPVQNIVTQGEMVGNQNFFGRSATLMGLLSE